MASRLAVGLLRIEVSPIADGRRLRARFAPILPLATGADGPGRGGSVDPYGRGALGVWSNPIHLDVDQALSIRVATAEHPPPLWWFPPAPRVVALDITAPGDGGAGIRYRRMDSRIPASWDVRTYLGRSFFHRNSAVVWPADGAGYLQPGFYTLSVVDEGHTRR